MENKNLNYCPTCQSNNIQHFADAYDAEYCTSDEMFRYDECQDCRLVFINPPPVDRLKEIYPPNYYSYSSATKVSFFERVKRKLDARLIKKLLHQIPGEQLSVLDVGGGWGWLLSVARDCSPRVKDTHIIDMNDAAKKNAEQQGHHFHTSRIETFDSKKRFDLILALNLIEHVENPTKVLENLSQLLSPDGLILIQTPNTDTLDQRIFRHRNWGGFHCPRHWVLFTIKNLSQLAQKCGLEIAQSEYTQGGPQWGNSIMGIMAKRGWVKITEQRPMYYHPLYVPICTLGAAFDFLRRPFFPTAQIMMTFRLNKMSQNRDNEKDDKQNA